MRDPARIHEILDDLRTLWLKNPDLRLGQLIVTLVRPAEPCPEVFQVEDSQLRKRIRRAVAGGPVEACDRR